MKWTEEELSIYEFSDRFIGNNDFETKQEFDVSEKNIEILSYNSDGDEVWNPINKFIVKDSVENHYFDGNIRVSGNHTFIESGKLINANEHPDFEKINKRINIVDFELGGDHTYFANGRINHNTTPGGKALPFFSSVRLRLKSAKKIKAKVNGIDEVIGIRTSVEVHKNRVGPPHRKTEFDIYYDSGIDDLSGLFTLAKNYKVLKAAGGYTKYKMVDTNSGEITEYSFQGYNGFKEEVSKNDLIRAAIKSDVADKMIMKYKSKSDINPEEIEIDENEVIGE